jgi:hypothetical protein
MLAGGAIGLVLIEVVNRQSFHWSMDLHVPWLSLLLFGTGLVALAAVAAVLAGRQAMRQERGAGRARGLVMRRRRLPLAAGQPGFLARTAARSSPRCCRGAAWPSRPIMAPIRISAPNGGMRPAG